MPSKSDRGPDNMGDAPQARMQTRDACVRLGASIQVVRLAKRRQLVASFSLRQAKGSLVVGKGKISARPDCFT